MTPFVAVIGAGQIGGAAAQAIAALDCVREVRLIDPAAPIAEGKALDIMQASPEDAHSTRLVGTGDVRASAGAAAIVIADAAAGSREWQGEEGLALVGRVWDVAEADGSTIVCAGAAHSALIRAAVYERHVDRRRIVGSAPAAFESAARALVALAFDGDGTQVGLMVLGAPPSAAVPCWSQATVSGASLSSRLSAAQIAAINARLPALWPPGPYALASAAARAVRAVALGARTEMTLSVALDGELEMRNVVTAVPVRLGPGGIEQIVEPALSPHERTQILKLSVPVQ